MGPTTFEKAFIKAIGKGFDETKVMFWHKGSHTFIKYPMRKRLLGIETYRNEDTIKQWAPYFKEFLETGVFDTNAYWVVYFSGEDFSDAVPIPMKLEKGLWNRHSSEHNKHMKETRENLGDCGFRVVPKPE